MSLFNKKKKNNKSNVGLKGFEKVERNGKLHYFYAADNGFKVVGGNLENMIASLNQNGINPKVEDKNLFEKSVIESRKQRYAESCDAYGVVNDKPEESYLNPYTEIPVGDKWAIISFDGSERFNIRRKDKESILELVDILNNDGDFPYKRTPVDLSKSYGSDGLVINSATGERLS